MQLWSPLPTYRNPLTRSECQKGKQAGKRTLRTRFRSWIPDASWVPESGREGEEAREARGGRGERRVRSGKREWNGILT